jgi:hypothetical protein
MSISTSFQFQNHYRVWMELSISFIACSEGENLYKFEKCEDFVVLKFWNIYDTNL